MSKNAILVVSFGTSHEDTRKKTIHQIEQEIQEAFPEYQVYTAFTSKMILNILRKRDGLVIHTVTEAMEAIKRDGIEQVIVQPTHILNGIENDRMIQDALAYSEAFQSIRFGAPLLHSTKDYWEVIKAFTKKLPQKQEGRAIVCMGHGTEHYTNASYAALDYMFKAYGREDLYMATVEAYPSLNDILPQLKAYHNILLVPFMIVAGDHAKNDMAGDDEDSWKSVLEKEGFEVECDLRGLGENKEIRKLYIAHVDAAIKEKNCENV